LICGRENEPDPESAVSILSVILVIVVVGFLLWLINRFIPMQSTVRSILNGLVIILLVLWLLDLFGLINVLNHTRVGT
jgi:VIT1/CCC1 family predicted Fe2+/Mn2+ transporter